MGNVFRSVLESGGVTPTPIIPSNSSPASMSANVAYEPTANGYAIESYSSVTPSDSTPVALTNGAIYKAGGAGYAIENQPATLTPNNTSPPSIASDTIYKGGGTGKAIASIATNGNGVTPSTSGQYFASGWNRMTSSGYAYSSEKLMKVGTFTNNTSAQTTVNCGFKPKYLAVTFSDPDLMWIYDERVSTTQYNLAGNQTYKTARNLGTTNANNLYSIDSTGFTTNKQSKAGTGYYFAIG